MRVRNGRLRTTASSNRKAARRGRGGRRRRRARGGGRTGLTTRPRVAVASGDGLAAVKAAHVLLTACGWPNMQAKGTCAHLVSTVALHSRNILDKLGCPHGVNTRAQAINGFCTQRSLHDLVTCPTMDLSDLGSTVIGAPINDVSFRKALGMQSGKCGLNIIRSRTDGSPCAQRVRRIKGSRSSNFVSATGLNRGSAGSTRGTGWH